MKINVLLFFSIIIFSCQNQKNKLIERNNEVEKDVLSFYSIHDSLFKLIAVDTNPKIYMKFYDTLMNKIYILKEKYQNIVPINDSSMEIFAKLFFQKYDSLARNEYKALLYYLTKPRFEMNKNDLSKIDSLYQRIDSIQNFIDEFIISKQKEFLQKFQLD